MRVLSALANTLTILSIVFTAAGADENQLKVFCKISDEKIANSNAMMTSLRQITTAIATIGGITDSHSISVLIPVLGLKRWWNVLVYSSTCGIARWAGSYSQL